ncbi:MAG: CBS domain-containing protein [Candidatus Marinimicrobia bacterium]|nr:CBS domain-containing protein [Candidatus Neomarinimicrobiota bacterium]
MQDNGTSLIIQELGYELKIGDAMTKDPIVVTPDSMMSDVRTLLKEKRISGLPVVKDEVLVGMVSIENFIRCILESCEDRKVSTNMTSKVVTLYEDEPLRYAIAKFEKSGYGRFPVINRKTGHLDGILTKGDIIKCVLNKLEHDFHKEEISRYRARHIFKDIKSDRTTMLFRYRIKGGEYDVAGQQSGYLKKNLLRLGIYPDLSRRVAIAACEAEMNIIIFTDGGELKVQVEEDRIQVNAMDLGPGIPDIEQAMQAGFSTAPDWVRDIGFGAGMGLPNIKKCSDEMRIESQVGKGTNLEFVVNT